MIPALRKYPRTPHLEGSRLQPGDEDLAALPLTILAGRHVVVEEKCDGANVAIRFGTGGRLLLQSRGHYLEGGARERQFAPLKAWASTCHADLRERLGSRYVLFGEWMYAKHTVFYDALPAYLLEFDVLDVEADTFLSTERRRVLLAGLGLASVPVLHAGPLPRPRDLPGLVGSSRLRSPAWRERLDAHAARRGLDPTRVRAETDPEDAMEGLYVKVEEEGRVVLRAKYVRASFRARVLDSGSHWMDRPLLPNLLGGDAS